MKKRTPLFSLLLLVLICIFGSYAISEKDWAEKVDSIKENGKTVGLEAVNFRGHTYQIFFGRETWDQARISCENLGGHLVSINSLQEQAFIELYLTQAKDLSKSYWIGITNRDKGNWGVWITGEKVTYKNWADGNPDRDKWDPGYGRIAADSYPEDNGWVLGRGNWDDEAINYKYIAGYICEWETIKDNDLPESDETIQSDDKGYQNQTTGSADSSSKTEKNTILFRNIPWGANLQQYEAAFEGNHISKNQNEYISRWSVRKAENDPGTVSLNDMYADGYPAGWGTLIYSMDRQDGLKVSGYHVSTVLGYFVYGVDQNGNVLRDEPDCRFYMAEYTFDAEDGFTAYDDLKGKLSILYGNGTEKVIQSQMLTVDDATMQAKYVDSVITRYVITDGRGTCMLEKIEAEGKCSSLALVYADEESDAMIDEVISAIKKERKDSETEDSVGNYDGL